MARNVVLDGMDVNHADSVVLNFGSLRTGPRPMMPYNFNRSNNAGCVAVDYDAEDIVPTFNSNRTTPAGPRPMMPYNFNRSNNAGCVAVDYDAEDIVLTFNSNRTTPAGPRPIAQHVQNVIGENHADDLVVNFR